MFLEPKKKCQEGLKSMCFSVLVYGRLESKSVKMKNFRRALGAARREKLRNREEHETKSVAYIVEK